MGEEQLWAVSEDKGWRLSVQRGVNRRINGSSVGKSRNRRPMAGTVRGDGRGQFRERRDVDRIFREEASVRDSRE